MTSFENNSWGLAEVGEAAAALETIQNILFLIDLAAENPEAVRRYILMGDAPGQTLKKFLIKAFNQGESQL